MTHHQNKIDAPKIGRILATVALAGAMLASAGVGGAYAGCGGGGGGGGRPAPVAQPQPPPTAISKEASAKLRKLRDMGQRLESEIKRGARAPLSEGEKSAMLTVLDAWSNYKGTTEYAEAWNAVVGAETATGSR